MENKDVTTNELAVMVKNGFDSIDERFNGIDGRFDQIDERFNQVDARLDRLERNQKVILTRLEDVVCRTEFDQLKEVVLIR